MEAIAEEEITAEADEKLLVSITTVGVTVEHAVFTAIVESICGSGAGAGVALIGGGVDLLQSETGSCLSKIRLALLRLLTAAELLLTVLLVLGLEALPLLVTGLNFKVLLSVGRPR